MGTRVWAWVGSGGGGGGGGEWVVCGFNSLKLYRSRTASLPHSTLLAEGTLQASMDRNCVVTGELFPFEFTADFSTFIKVGGLWIGWRVWWGRREVFVALARV